MRDSLPCPHCETPVSGPFKFDLTQDDIVCPHCGAWLYASRGWKPDMSDPYREDRLHMELVVDVERYQGELSRLQAVVAAQEPESVRVQPADTPISCSGENPQ